MHLYWFAPILCGACGLGLGFIIKRYLLGMLQRNVIEDILLSDQVTTALQNGIGAKIVELTQDTRTVAEVMDAYMGEESRLAMIDSGSTMLAGVITVELKKSNLSDIILDEIKRVLEEKVKLGFITGLMKGNLWNMVQEPMEKAIQKYLDNKCQSVLEDKLKHTFTELTEKRMYEIGEVLLSKGQQISKIVIKEYKNNIVELVEQCITPITENNLKLKKQLNKLIITFTGFGVLCGIMSIILALY